MDVSSIPVRILTLLADAEETLSVVRVRQRLVTPGVGSGEGGGQGKVVTLSARNPPTPSTQNGPPRCASPA